MHLVAYFPSWNKFHNSCIRTMQIGSVFPRVSKPNLCVVSKTYVSRRNNSSSQSIQFGQNWDRPLKKSKQNKKNSKAKHCTLMAVAQPALRTKKRAYNIVQENDLCLTSLIPLPLSNTHIHIKTHTHAVHTDTHGLVLLMLAHLCSGTRAASLALITALSFPCKDQPTSPCIPMDYTNQR